MANMTKNVVIGSMGVAGLVAIAAIIDLIAGFPFSGLMLMDILFLLGAGLVIYMGWDSYQDLR